MLEAGDRAVVIFTDQRTDCDAGVELLVYRCAMGRDAIRRDRRIPWPR